MGSIPLTDPKFRDGDGLKASFLIPPSRLIPHAAAGHTAGNWMVQSPVIFKHSWGSKQFGCALAKSPLRYSNFGMDWISPLWFSNRCRASHRVIRCFWTLLREHALGFASVRFIRVIFEEWKVTDTSGGCTADKKFTKARIERNLHAEIDVINGRNG